MIATCLQPHGGPETARRFPRTARRGRPAVRGFDWKPRAERLLHLPIRYVPHPDFTQPDAEDRFARDPSPADKTPGFSEETGVLECAPNPEPTRLGPLYRAGLLTGEEQRRLFLRMNYARYVAARLQERLRRAPDDSRLVEAIERRLAEAVALRNRLVEANLRLVPAAARRFVDSHLPLEDLVSAGHLPLIRAVELFDVSRGHCFSTYATNAVRNHFLRLRARNARRTQFQSSCAPALLDAVPAPDLPTGDPRELVRQRQQLADRLLATLTQREQTILAARFGLAGDEARTFQEVGDLVGLSKERVRVITHRALERLQEAVRDQRLELPEP